MIIVASGVFNIIHKGHVEYLKKAKELGGFLIVLIDGNDKTIKNKGYIYLNENEKEYIIKELKCVDEVRIINDPVSTILEQIKPDIFAKGGDRIICNLPKDEIDVCEKYNIKIICGLGEKINSSSNIYQKINMNERKY
jgi:cytidyltransferase-like protein